MHRMLALALLLLCGCSTTLDTRPEGPLALQLGQQIELTGPIGFGKQANYVVSNQQEVYLPTPATDYTRLKPGTAVRVKGKLEFNRGANGLRCTDYDCEVPGIPPHYFIRGATIEVLR